MIIHEPTIRVTDEVAKVSAIIEFDKKAHELWFTVPIEYKEYLVTERCDAFFTSVLMLAMKRNENIHIKGTISERLYFNITSYYMHLLTVLDPSLSKIEITYENLDNGKAFSSADSVVMGFSGGIDSFSALYDHHFCNKSQNYKISHLVFNKVNDSEACDSNEAQYEKLQSFAQSNGLPYFKIDSNMHEFNDFSFVKSYLIRNASALLAVQKLVGKYVISSSYKYQDITVGKSYSMGFSESVTAPLLSTENMQTIISGAQHTRVEKTKLVSEIPASTKYLDVCVSSNRVDPSKNCSVCFKCLRTELTLDILGKLDQYKDVFDLEKYSKARFKYASRVLRCADEYDEEINHLAKERGFKFTVQEYIWATPIFYHARKVLRKLTQFAVGKDKSNMELEQDEESIEHGVLNVKHGMSRTI